MKRFLFFACLGCMLIGMASCKKSDKTEDVVNEITIYGNVIDRTTGQPLFNVIIKEKNKVGGSTVTGNDGNYEFTLPLNGSSSGKYYLVASKDKYSSSEYELIMSNVDKNRRVKVDFQLVKESITYTGTVVDSQNKPIFDAHISAQFSYSGGKGTEYNIGTTTMTDVNGIYTLELPRPHINNISSYDAYDQWKFAITATKSDYVSLTHTLNQNVDDMGKVITLNFVMKSIKEQEEEDHQKEIDELKATGVTIYGKVTDASGTPIVNATIKQWVSRYDADNTSEYNYTNLISTTQTNSNGEYEIISRLGYDVYQPNSTTHYVNCRNHKFVCEAVGYNSSYKTLYVTSSDQGKSYNFDFKLTKK